METNAENLDRKLEDQVHSIDDYLAHLSERPPPQNESRLAEEQAELVSWVRGELMQVHSSLDAALFALRHAR